MRALFAVFVMVILPSCASTSATQSDQESGIANASDSDYLEDENSEEDEDEDDNGGFSFKAGGIPKMNPVPTKPLAKPLPKSFVEIASLEQPPPEPPAEEELADLNASSPFTSLVNPAAPTKSPSFLGPIAPSGSTRRVYYAKSNDSHCRNSPQLNAKSSRTYLQGDIILASTHESSWLALDTDCWAFESEFSTQPIPRFEAPSVWQYGESSSSH